MVWEIINRDRKRRKKANEEIEMKKWKEYFARLLSEVEGTVIRRERKVRGEEEGGARVGRNTERDKEIKRWKSGKDGRGS